MRGLIDNSVNIGGDQVIIGTKTYKKNLVIDASNITLGTPPDATTYIPALTFIDSLGRNFGGVRASYTTNNQVSIEVLAQRNETGTYYSGSGGVKLLNTGGARFSVPATSSNDSAIAQQAISKAQNGYVKLGNGLIIQWGYNGGFGTDTVVTLPTPFSNANYSVVPTILSSTKYGFPTYLKAHTATNFTGERNDNNKPPMLWIAIGY